MRQRVGFVLVLAVVAVGCTPRFRINRTVPAEVALPPDPRIALIVEADGQAPTASIVLDAAVSVTRGQVLNKWLAVEPVRQEFTAQLRGAGYALVDRAAANVLFRVRPTRWNYELRDDPKEGTSGKGRLDVQVEVLDPRAADDKPFYRGSYWATSSVKGLTGEPEAIVRAARSVVDPFLSELQPRRISQEVELDDDDPSVEAGIALCKRGSFEAAEQAFADAVSRNPGSAPALYDLGVLVEARGDYDQAESLVTRASQLAGKPLYYEAIERIRRSRRDAQALQAQ